MHTLYHIHICFPLIFTYSTEHVLTSISSFILLPYTASHGLFPFLFFPLAAASTNIWLYYLYYLPFYICIFHSSSFVHFRVHHQFGFLYVALHVLHTRGTTGHSSKVSSRSKEGFQEPYPSIYSADASLPPSVWPRQKSLHLSLSKTLPLYLIVQACTSTSFTPVLLYHILLLFKWPSSPTGALSFTHVLLSHILPSSK